MLNFAPDPETTVDVTALRALRATTWTGRHRAPRHRDPLATLSLLAVVLGGLLMAGSLLGLLALVAWVHLS